MLNFRGRVGRPSIKNFILEEVNESNHEVLLFGKASDSKFNMDISGPLSPMIGFAIALSSFDSRIMCEWELGDYRVDPNTSNYYMIIGQSKQMYSAAQFSI